MVSAPEPLTRVRTAALGALLVLHAVACAHEHGSKSESERDAASGEAAEATPGHVGARAFVTLMPIDAEQRAPELSYDGEGTLSQTGGGVDLQLSVNGCERNAAHELVILAGSDCSEATLRGDVWHEGGGDRLPAISCVFITNRAQVSYTRESRNAEPWTIGSPARSNVLGHALVVRRSNGDPLSCGVITQAPDLDPVQIDPTEQPAPEHSAILAGLCLWKTIVPDSARSCPDPKELSDCASEHCSLSACIRECADYLACLGDAGDACQREFACAISDPCTDCRNEVWMCTFRFCAEQIACAPPSGPDGPCAQLQACCAMQGDYAQSCLDNVRLLEKLSGDASCVGAMHDWDFASHLPVPCKFQ